MGTLLALACLRAMGVGIEDMRTYQANRARGHEAAGEQRDLAAASRRADRRSWSAPSDRPRPRRLGWRPRPAETTIAETAESLRDLGLLARR